MENMKSLVIYLHIGIYSLNTVAIANRNGASITDVAYDPPCVLR